MHYYQFNIGDYSTHTRHLSIYADLAYRRLLDWYYLNEKPIPTDPQQAAKLILMKNRYPDVEEVLTEFFQLTENGWINKRADKEISVYKGFVDAGKRGAAKRWLKGGDSPPTAPPIANNKHKPLTINQEPVNRKQETTKEAGATFVLPDWIDKDHWNLWMKTRKGKKMIPEQMQAQVNKLAKWRDDGLDYKKALFDAASAGWQGLFEPKQQIQKSTQSDNDQIRELARKRLFGEMKNATE